MGTFLDLGSVRVRFEADARGAVAAMSALTGRLDQLIGTAKRRLSEFGDAFSTLSAVGGALVGAKVLADAESIDLALEKLRASTGETTEQFQVTRLALIALSRDTGIAVSRLTAAAVEVRRAGFTGADGMTVLQASAQLAQATLTDVASAAQVTARVMAAYKRPVEDAAQVTARLLQSASLAGASFESFGQSVTGVVTLAGGLGVALEDTLALLSAITRAEADTERGAVQTRLVIQGLIDPSKEARAAIEAVLGSTIEYALAARGLSRVVGELIAASNGSSEALLRFFPNIRSFGGVLKISADSAAVLADNLKALTGDGSLEKLNAKAAAIEGSFAQIVERIRNLVTTGVQDFFVRNRQAIIDAAAAVEQFLRANGEMLITVTKVVGAFALFSAAVLLVKGAIYTITSALSGVQVIIKLFTSDIPALAGHFASFAGSVSKAAVALSRFIGLEAVLLRARAASQINKLNAAGATGLAGFVSQQSGVVNAAGIKQAVSVLFPEFTKVEAVVRRVGAAMTGLAANVGNLGGVLRALAGSAISALITGFRSLGAVLASVAVAAGKVALVVARLSVVATVIGAVAYGFYKLGGWIQSFFANAANAETEMDRLLERQADFFAARRDRQVQDGIAQTQQRTAELAATVRDLDAARKAAEAGEEGAIARIGELAQRLKELQGGNPAIIGLLAAMKQLEEQFASGQLSGEDLTKARLRYDEIAAAVRGYQAAAGDADRATKALADSASVLTRAVAASKGAVVRRGEEITEAVARLQEGALTETERARAALIEQATRLGAIAEEVRAEADNLSRVAASTADSGAKAQADAQVEALRQQGERAIKAQQDVQARIAELDRQASEEKVRATREALDEIESLEIETLQREERFREAEERAAILRYQRLVRRIQSETALDEDQKRQFMAAADRAYQSELRAIERNEQKRFEATEEGRKQTQRAEDEKRRQERLTEAALLRQQLIQAEITGDLRLQAKLRDQITKAIEDSGDAAAIAADRDQRTVANARERLALLRQEIEDRRRAGQGPRGTLEAIRGASSDIIGATDIGSFRAKAREKLGAAGSKEAIADIGNGIRDLLNQELDALDKELAAELRKPRSKRDAGRVEELRAALRDATARLGVLGEEQSRAEGGLLAGKQPEPEFGTRGADRVQQAKPGSGEVFKDRATGRLFSPKPSGIAAAPSGGTSPATAALPSAQPTAQATVAVETTLRDIASALSEQTGTLTAAIAGLGDRLIESLRTDVGSYLRAMDETLLSIDGQVAAIASAGVSESFISQADGRA